MTYGLVGMYALFFIFVGTNQNGGRLFDEIEKDARGFAPYLLAILILMALEKSDTLRPFVTPFIGLAILSFVLHNYGKIASQVNEVTGLTLPTGA